MDSDSKSPAGILGIIGGAMLIVGSFMTWVSVKLDVNAFAELLGVDPSLLTGAGVPTSDSSAGTKTSDGKITLVMGIIVVIFAVMLAVRKRASKGGGIAMIIGGGIAAAAVLLNLSTKDAQIDSELEKLGPDLTALGITTEQLKSIFDLEWGIGIYICLVGGVVAVIAGIMALRSSSAAPAMPATSGVPADGFGAAAPSTPAMPPAAGTMPPASPPPPAPGEPPSSTP